MANKDDKKSKNDELSQESLEKLAKQVDKMALNSQKKQVNEMLQGKTTSSSSAKMSADLRVQLETMMKNLALMEENGMLKSGSGGSKSMAKHKFWNTQPVPKHGNAKRKREADLEGIPSLELIVLLGEQISDIGPIEPSVPVDQVAKEPPPLPKEFEWCEIDMTNEDEVSNPLPCSHQCFCSIT